MPLLSSGQCFTPVLAKSHLVFQTFLPIHPRAFILPLPSTATARCTARPGPRANSVIEDLDPGQTLEAPRSTPAASVAPTTAPTGSAASLGRVVLGSVTSIFWGASLQVQDVAGTAPPTRPVPRHRRRSGQSALDRPALAAQTTLLSARGSEIPFDDLLQDGSGYRGQADWSFIPVLCFPSCALARSPGPSPALLLLSSRSLCNYLCQLRVLQHESPGPANLSARLPP